MSLFSRASFACPLCGAAAEADAVASVNADRRPDLRTAILDGTFQATTCPACAATIRLPPRFVYTDVRRGQWLVAHPPRDLPRWAELEAEAAAVFARGYGTTAPKAAREVGAGLSARAVFGWPALREKLLAAALGLDDVTLELLKLAVIRDIPGAPFGATTELRLHDVEAGAEAGVEADDLVLRWSNLETETPLSQLRLPRKAFADVAADVAGWADLRTELAGRLFVDTARLLSEPVP